MKSFFGIIQKSKDILLGGGDYHCPLCQRSYSKFLPYGIVPSPERANAICPGCGSFERHRLLWIALEELWKANKIGRNGKMLHIAPEKCLEKKFSDVYNYLSVDIDGRNAMQTMDITDIKLPDGAFDAIICNHVLEHIPDDRKAISELYRVLKKDGWACIQVPMFGEITEEDLSVTDPQERLRVYGQSDHVRRYGRDFKLRLENGGFTVNVFKKEYLLEHEMLKKVSVDCESEVWISIK